MNPRQTFVRKIIYVGMMIPLIVLLAVIGMPASPGAAGSPGGWLARLREEHGLSITTLGDVDPASETLKLATLGLRGPASLLLWEKANDYKMRKDWTNLSATCEQIAKFQPNFVAVWRFQGWNLAYNVSAEFDGYRDRYAWVIRGVHYLEKGIRYNKNDAILIWDRAYTIQHKIGRSDERKEFRVLFREDDDFHGDRAVRDRDSWLVAKEGFEECLAAVDGGARMRGTPVVYRSNPAMCQMNYAEAIEKEGAFGEVARWAWKRAGDDWQKFGAMDLPGSTGQVIHLNDLEPRQEDLEKLIKQLEQIEPGLREKIVKEKREALTEAQREALDTPAARRTAKQSDLASLAQIATTVTEDELAHRIKGSQRKQALQLSQQIDELRALIGDIRGSRDIVNFDYWRARAEMEQSRDTVDAREAAYRGDEALGEPDPQSAKRWYEIALERWRRVLDRHPFMLQNETSQLLTLDDLGDLIDYYRRALKLLDEPFPKQFILQDIVDLRAKQP